MEMSAEGQQAAAETELRAIAADPVRRREYLLRQSMYASIAREQEIV
jgi:hypothetical protein